MNRRDEDPNVDYEAKAEDRDYARHGGHVDMRLWAGQDPVQIDAPA